LQGVRNYAWQRFTMLTTAIKKHICDLFEVIDDEAGVQRVITPLEYPGSNDKIVVRVRPTASGWQIDENGESAFYAALNGGDVDSEIIDRWSEDAHANHAIVLDENEVLSVNVSNELHITPQIFQIAAAAQQLFTLSTSRRERVPSDFREQVAEIIHSVASSLNISVQDQFELPIGGGLIADHIIEKEAPLIVIAASSNVRLLEAEVIHMQYRLEGLPGFVLAVAESEKAVGKKQYHRANYYTGKTVEFNQQHLGQLVRGYLH